MPDSVNVFALALNMFVDVEVLFLDADDLLHMLKPGLSGSILTEYQNKDSR